MGYGTGLWRIKPENDRVSERTHRLQVNDRGPVQRPLFGFYFDSNARAFPPHSTRWQGQVRRRGDLNSEWKVVRQWLAQHH